MTPRHRRAVALAAALLFLLLVPVASAQDQQGPWKAELEVGNPEPVLGEEVYVKIEITNTSGGPVVMPYLLGWGGPFCGLDIEPLDESYRAQFQEDLHRSIGDPLGVAGSKRSYPGGETVVLGWDRAFRTRRTGEYRLQYRCEIPVDAIHPEVNPRTRQLESNDEVWRGSFSSNEAAVRVVDPVGIDAQAYEALDHAPINSDRFGELLGRFPDSIYAGYVIWALHAKGTATWDTDIALGLAREGNRYGNEIPCFHEEGCRADHWMSMSANQVTAWENKWFSTVLRSHPDAWFSDEVRLRFALNLYSIGDHASCEARLEDLAEHGRADVAAKAADILTAMRAKGMLEGAETPPAAAPDPAPVAAPVPAAGAER